MLWAVFFMAIGWGLAEMALRLSEQTKKKERRNLQSQQTGEEERTVIEGEDRNRSK